MSFLKNFRPRSIQVQLAAIIVGIPVALLIANIDYRDIAKAWKIYVPASYLLLLATFVIGEARTTRLSAKRWLNIPIINISVQPSEFLKLAFILSFAYHVYKTQDKLNHPVNILLLCVHALIPIALVQLQGDSGTALMFACIFLAMLFIAGIKAVYIIVAGVASPVIVLLAWNFLLSEMQKRRFLAILEPASTNADSTIFQQSRAALAIGSGKLTGNGIFSDSHVYVPEIHNDFIFAFIGDALGFLGCLAVIAVITLLCTKLLYNCVSAKDKQGQIICAGVFAMIFFQSAINIGMCLSILPVIGNSLPFISSGGSSILANYIGIGLALSVYKHTERRKVADNFLPINGYPVIEWRPRDIGKY